VSIAKLVGKKSPYAKMLGRARHAADYDAAIPARLKQEMTALFTACYLPCAIYVFDYKNSEYQFLSETIEHITGFDAGQYYFRGKAHHLQSMHPDDCKLYTGEVTKTLLRSLRHIKKQDAYRYLFSINYRYCRADGKYIHLLQQFRIVQCSMTGVPLHVVGTLSDISFLKPDNAMRLYIAKGNSRKMLFTSAHHTFSKKKNSLLSPRQHEVLQLAHDGKTVQETADILHIGFNTAKTHRQRIIARLKARNIRDAWKKAGY
jgi:DNA-binding CsgD family transcriptional regulator